ncbi:sugar-transfer associated ATP-grasp domain-containing protein [Bacteroidota bacterium]
MKEKIILKAKNIGVQILKHRYHLLHNHQAKKVLKSIEQEKGRTASDLIRLSDEYAKDVLGWRGYAPWLYVYSAVAEKFHEGWIPDNYYFTVVVPIIQGNYGKVSGLKSLSSTIFSSPEFPDIGFYANGLFLTRDHSIVKENKLEEFLFKNGETMVYKTDQSYQGKGFFLLHKNSFDPNKVKLLGNGVFQDYIDQHGFFDTLLPNSVATLRITTITDHNSKVSVRACYLRLGRLTDSHVKSVSHIRIPVDLTNGELGSLGYLPNWQAIEKHPDTHIAFSNSRIPCFTKFLSTAIKLHQLVPYVRSVGWDMILDKNENVKVMEWNGYSNDIKFSEATQGPCFKDLGWEKLWHQAKTK